MADQDSPAGPSNPPSLTPISSQALYCLRRFETICDELRNLEQEIAIQNGYDRNIVLLTMLDSRAKFKAWGTSIAAFRQGHVPTSLDFRLRDALEIRSRLLKVLEYLAEYLNDASEIILGNKPNQAWNDDMSIDSDSENDLEENDRGNDLNPAQDTTDLHELCRAICSSNGSLMKLSMLIRESSNRDDYLKAASRYSTWEPSPFISHVREKYGAAKGSNGWLVERLGKAIMRRRQFLTYREEHHGKLTGDWGEDLHEVIEEKGPDVSKLAKTVASTRATTFIVDGNASKKEDVDLAGSFGSQTSYEATEFEGDGTAPTKLTVPPPPKWAFSDVPFEYGEPFQCPYCYTEQEVKNKAAWKKHIFRDLKPYVCTFAECALRMFRSRNEWFAHELQCHRREWVCQHCQHAAFASASAFSRHLEVTHTEVLKNYQLKALLLQSEEPVDKIRPNACPLCDGWELDLNNLNQGAKRLHLHGGNVVEPYGTLKQFRRHLGRHMEQLALFALPIKESDDLEDDSADETDGNDSESLDDAKRAISNTAEETRISNDFQGQNILPYTTAPGEPSISPHSSSPVTMPPMTSGPEMQFYYGDQQQASDSQESLDTLRVVHSRPEPQCWDHGCNGRKFSTFSNLLRHQREKSGMASKPTCPRCGAEFTSTTARNGHMVHEKCKPARKKVAEAQVEEENNGALEHTEEAKSYTAKEPGNPSQKPIRFKDALGRKLRLHLNVVSTWDLMDGLIREGFRDIPEIWPLVQEGNYDLIGPDGEIISPQAWETYIKPDMSITMHMRSVPEPATLPPPENRIDSIENSQTPLPLAAFNEHEEAVQQLLDAGADVDTTSGRYSNALQEAAVNRNEEVVKLLFDAGADLVARSGSYSSALQAAAENGHEEVVTPLLEQKGKANSKDEDSLTPLHSEALSGIPPDARWTRINRKLVNPEALDEGKERYEARDDFVAVLRVLTKEEIEAYAVATARIRAARRVELEREAHDEGEIQRGPPALPAPEQDGSDGDDGGGNFVNPYQDL